MPKFETYCQVGFLESFFDSIPEVSFAKLILTEEEDDILAYKKMMNVLFKDSDLLIDDWDKLVANAQINPFFMRLINEHNASGGTTIHDFEPDFVYLLSDEEYIKQINPLAIHCYKDASIWADRGIFVKDKENWKNGIKQLSHVNSYKVHRNEKMNNFSDWRFLKNMELPINAAVIADNYILKKKELFENNLGAIIENLLPDKLLDTVFHLSILTARDIQSPAIKLKRIIDYINALSKPYKVEVSLHLSSLNEPHDRDIITNYYRLHSGHSLDYYDRNGNISKSTSLDLFALNGAKDNPHQLILNEYKGIVKHAKQGFDLFGSGKNRLLK